MKTIAVVGPDGAGKTTYIRDLADVARVFHAIPVTSKMPKVDRKWYRLSHEFIMGIEKMLRYAYLHINRNSVNGLWVLDRCALDAEAYAALWSIQTKSVWPLRIALAFNTFAFLPDEVVFFKVDPKKAKPKRNYTEQDLAELNSLFTLALELNGYAAINVPDTYNLGVREQYQRVSLPQPSRIKMTAYGMELIRATAGIEGKIVVKANGERV